MRSGLGLHRFPPHLGNDILEDMKVMLSRIYYLMYIWIFEDYDVIKGEGLIIAMLCWQHVNLWVTSKVFTPCLGVLHDIWGTCCMISIYMVHDGFVHGRWFVMD